MAETVKAKMVGSIIKVDGPQGEEAVLVQMDVDCPICGAYSIIVNGHHLANLRDLIVEAMDLYPELTKPGRVANKETFSFGGRKPGDPTVN